ncbi:rhomboid family protein [Haliscomenobacter hydrossis]|uniref:Rhomboid family protein n=1 Tax=Haliscomenobacter hydrossis (strain ATCC 27775 / DSM 1100 / LMG 10767 / O) TaxID=760192 RepID=F4KZL0_HALH1|nr:rhomboid family intramembrane serine protease [Haliscomenobacter hydrossis]AEE49480.1 Rhomboid family protein [Haliscomenobacter hydrossis DSM 1100]
MNDLGLIGFILLLANFLFSYKGFTNPQVFAAYKFEVDSILFHKDFKRLVSSAFLHVNWMHLIFNMLSLYAFSNLLENQLGGLNFVLLYLTSLVGGNLLALFVHRQHGSYSAVGASGAVCGVIFASIALFPGIEVGTFFLPFQFPGWLFGLLYVAISIYGIKSKRGNIGHEAHLGGALIGVLLACYMQPEALAYNLFTIAIIALPMLAFILIILARPDVLVTDNFNFKKNKRYYTLEDRTNEERTNRQQEVDRLLDKIKQKGLNSLTAKEQQTLQENSKKNR